MRRVAMMSRRRSLLRSAKAAWSRSCRWSEGSAQLWIASVADLATILAWVTRCKGYSTRECGVGAAEHSRRHVAVACRGCWWFPFGSVSPAGGTGTQNPRITWYELGEGVDEG